MDVIKWIVDTFIYQSKSLSEYTITYSIAMMMNLSFSKKGRNKFELETERVMQVLLSYMSYKEYPQLQTSINGTLYTLLKRRSFVEAAKKFDVEGRINAEMNVVTDMQVKKQLPSRRAST